MLTTDGLPVLKVYFRKCAAQIATKDAAAVIRRAANRALNSARRHRAERGTAAGLCHLLPQRASRSGRGARLPASSLCQRHSSSCPASSRLRRGSGCPAICCHWWQQPSRRRQQRRRPHRSRGPDRTGRGRQRNVQRPDASRRSCVCCSGGGCGGLHCMVAQRQSVKQRDAAPSLLLWRRSSAALWFTRQRINKNESLRFGDCEGASLCTCTCFRLAGVGAGAFHVQASASGNACVRQPWRRTWHRGVTNLDICYIYPQGTFPFVMLCPDPNWTAFQ